MSPAATSAPIPPSRQREKPGQSLKWIGKSMKRVEDPRLLTGQGLQDVADIQIGAALRSGELSPDELREIAIFLTHYAGWPSGARLSMQVEKLVSEHARAQQRERHPDT